jgi:hypothetical protein
MKTLAESVIENFNFFREQDLSKFAGKWVIIVNKKIVDSGDNLKQLMENANSKYPKEEPFVARAPSGKALIL